MDAFHIGHRVLVRHGLTDVKGAPETFDALGFLHLLRRIRTETEETVYAPEFDRDIEDSLAHVTEISPSVRLVMVEGNYLLLDTPPWDGVRPLLDQAWFVHLADDERRPPDGAPAREPRSLTRRCRRAHLRQRRAATPIRVNSRLISPDLWIEQSLQTWLVWSGVPRTAAASTQTELQP